MDDRHQAIADLQVYRAMLVTARRKLIAIGVHGNKTTVRAPVAPHEVVLGPGTSRSAEVRAFQNDIDATNRALLDERHEKMGSCGVLTSQGPAHQASRSDLAWCVEHIDGAMVALFDGLTMRKSDTIAD